MKISVVMSVHNAEDTVSDAIKSILRQSYSDFEFIIINDGSTDKTTEQIKKFDDPRILVIDQKNVGLTKSLNRGIKMSTGDLIARQDADDFSFKKRLEVQHKAFLQTPGLVLLGSNSIDKYGNGKRVYWGYKTDFEIKKKILLMTPFPHSSAMFRRTTFLKVGAYDEIMETSQDMELWMRFSKIGIVSMIKEPLIERTVSEKSISKKKWLQQFLDATSARIKHRQSPMLIIIIFSFLTLILHSKFVLYLYLILKNKMNKEFSS